jgi:ABC-2 type transport system ATP-binding protein
MIQFNHVTRKFGSKVAVCDLTLEVPSGELFAFLGPNGAGKTTAIKILVGLLRPTAGGVTVCGVDPTSETRQASQYLGFVPEEVFLYDKLTGREFLEFVAEIRGFSRSEASYAIARQCELFELDGFFDELTETYSHGMRQRLVFASALLHDPPVLVVDEPMVGMDPKSTRLVKDLLRQRTAAGGTVFMSTHTLSLAEEIADRIGIIDRGWMNFLGTLGQLRQEASDHQTSLERLFLERTDNHPDYGKSQITNPK